MIIALSSRWRWSVCLPAVAIAMLPSKAADVALSRGKNRDSLPSLHRKESDDDGAIVFICLLLFSPLLSRQILRRGKEEDRHVWRGVAWGTLPLLPVLCLCTRQSQLIAAVFGKEMPSLVVRTFVFRY